MKRRSVLTGIAISLGMPSIVKAENLMRLYVPRKFLIGEAYRIITKTKSIEFMYKHIDCFENLYYSKEIRSLTDKLAIEKATDILSHMNIGYTTHTPAFSSNIDIYYSYTNYRPYKHSYQ